MNLYRKRRKKFCSFPARLFKEQAGGPLIAGSGVNVIKSFFATLRLRGV